MLQNTLLNLRPSFGLRRIFVTLLVFAPVVACGERIGHGVLEGWMAQADGIEIGTVVEGAEQHPAGPRQLRAAGFAQLPDGRWERTAKLSASPMLMPLDMGALTNIGAVSVLSIDRNNGQTPYLYATLRSIFAELPAHSVVNVFVGDNRVDYVALDQLERELGKDAAQRVHVVASAEADVAFMKAHKFSLSERASWNYARMLRAYSGALYHLTFEDDVQLSRGSVYALDRMLSGEKAGTVSMYNNKCGSAPGTQLHLTDRPHIATHRKDRDRAAFWGTQGTAFRGSEGAEIGHYIQAHLGEEPFDLLLHKFLRTHHRYLGYVQPSMVQHMGVLTTGLGFQHQSACFPQDFPAL